MANRFAVGIGAGKTWTNADTSLWSATSGGASGASVPGSGDVAIFDAASGGSGAYAVSLNYSPTCDINFAGISAAVPLLIRSSARGTQRTITAGVVTVGNYVHFQDIVGAGAGSWNISGVESGDCGGNSGITFATGATQYWYTATTGAKTWSTAGNWYLGSGGTGGAGRVPLPQDTARFDSASIGAASTTVTQDMPRIGSVDWTGVTNTPTFTPSTTASVFGSITHVSGMTITSGGAPFTLEGRGSHTLTSAGQSWGIKPFVVDCVTGEYALQDAFSLTGNTPLTFTSGTFTTNYTVTVGQVSTSGTLAKVINMGSGYWYLNTASNPWNANASGVTLNAGTSTIRLQAVMTVAHTFHGNGKTYNNIECAATGAFALQFSGSNTFNNFHIDASAAARTVLFTAGTTTTVGSMTRDAGTNVITIGSITAASHTLTKTGGGFVSMDYLSVSRSTAGPTTTWYAGTHSTDGGNNSGWYFTLPSVTVTGTAAYSTWTAPAATAYARLDAPAAYASWTAPSATAYARLDAPAAYASWVAPNATAQEWRVRVISASVSRSPDQSAAVSRSSYSAEVS